MRTFRRLLVVGIVCVALPVHADYIPGGVFYRSPFQQQSQNSCKNPGNPCGTSNKTITFYLPINTSNCAVSIQGCMTTSVRGLDGRNDPVTVDAVRLGKAKYATCASDSSNYGMYFNIGTVTYRSWLDRQMHTVQNVVCYVHDTGGAFRGHPEKLDLATSLCPGCTDADAKRLASGSTINSIGQGLLNFGSAVASGLGGGQVLTQDYYCVVSIEPVIVHLVPAGSVFPSNCYNSAPTNPFTTGMMRPMMPFSSSIASTPLGAAHQTQQQSPSSAQAPTTPPPPAALIIVQPSSVGAGATLLVAWSTVGMSREQQCSVAQDGAIFASQNAGSKVVHTAGETPGPTTFTLSCTSLSGQPVTQTAQATIQ